MSGQAENPTPPIGLNSEIGDFVTLDTGETGKVVGKEDGDLNYVDPRIGSGIHLWLKIGDNPPWVPVSVSRVVSISTINNPFGRNR